MNPDYRLTIECEDGTDVIDITLPYSFPAEWCLREDASPGEVTVKTEDELVNIIEGPLTDSGEAYVTLVRLTDDKIVTDCKPHISWKNSLRFKS